jgi:hypothetical protein
VRWFAIHHELATNPKWLDLSMDERGAWISLLTIAAAAEERGTLRDRATAAALLQREMRQASRPAAHLVDTLIELGLIDEDEDGGTISFHDFDEWQLRIKKPSDWPEAIRERVERHRRKKKEKQKEERKGELEGEVEVTPRNALPTSHEGTNGTALSITARDGLYACPACGAPVLIKKGKAGTFYSCSAWGGGFGCSWKSNAPPPKPALVLDQAAALADIRRQDAERIADILARAVGREGKA